MKNYHYREYAKEFAEGYGVKAISIMKSVKYFKERQQQHSSFFLSEYTIFNVKVMLYLLKNNSQQNHLSCTLLTNYLQREPRQARP